MFVVFISSFIAQSFEMTSCIILFGERLWFTGERKIKTDLIINQVGLLSVNLSHFQTNCQRKWNYIKENQKLHLFVEVSSCLLDLRFCVCVCVCSTLKTCSHYFMWPSVIIPFVGNILFNYSSPVLCAKRAQCCVRFHMKSKRNMSHADACNLRTLLIFQSKNFSCNFRVSVLSLCGSCWDKRDWYNAII